MKKYKSSWLLILLIILFMSGCETNQQQQDEFSFEDVHSGTDGLLMSFYPNAPPIELGEDEDFQVILSLNNHGASDIKNGIIRLITEDYVTLKDQSDKKTYDISGKNKFDLTGETKPIKFSLKSNKIENQSQIQKTTIIATACYQYSTLAKVNVCIDPDYLNVDNYNQHKVCTVQSHSLGSEGAPVEVSLIEPKFSSSEGKVKPSYLIHVKNVGQGQIIKQDEIEDVCSSSPLKKDSFNTVYIKAKLGTADMDCKGNNKDNSIHLSDGEGFTKCSLPQPLDSTSPYTSFLQIQLDYGYTESISTFINIKSS